MSKYAERTRVPVAQSRTEIERALTRYGADAFAFGWEGGRSVVQFRAAGRYVRVSGAARTRLEVGPIAERRRSDEACICVRAGARIGEGIVKWWERRMVAFDLETTSADPEEARIVSAAVAFVGGGEPTESWSTLVDPGVPIPEEATEVNGITDAMVQADGIGTRTALVRILSRITSLDRTMPLIAFNARYDLTVIDREIRRLGGIGLAGEFEARVVDPIVIECHLDRYRPKRVASHSLEDCCKVWNVKLDEAHDAAFDAIAAARLAYRLARDGRVIRRTRNPREISELRELVAEWERVRHDLAELFQFQRRIAWVEAERLEAYFRAGDASKDVPAQPDRVVPRDWPVIPYGG